MQHVCIVNFLLSVLMKQEWCHCNLIEYQIVVFQFAGSADTALCGVVGREPAMDCVVDAFNDCIVPIWNKGCQSTV